MQVRYPSTQKNEMVILKSKRKTFDGKLKQS